MKFKDRIRLNLPTISAVVSLLVIAAAWAVGARAETGLAMECVDPALTGQRLGPSFCPERRWVRPTPETLIATCSDGPECSAWFGEQARWAPLNSISNESGVLVCTADLEPGVIFTSDDPCPMTAKLVPWPRRDQVLLREVEMFSVKVSWDPVVSFTDGEPFTGSPFYHVSWTATSEDGTPVGIPVETPTAQTSIVLEIPKKRTCFTVRATFEDTLGASSDSVCITPNVKTLSAPANVVVEFGSP